MTDMVLKQMVDEKKDGRISGLALLQSPLATDRLFKCRSVATVTHQGAHPSQQLSLVSTPQTIATLTYHGAGAAAPFSDMVVTG
jgi:hypothetical protein